MPVPDPFAEDPVGSAGNASAGAAEPRHGPSRRSRGAPPVLVRQVRGGLVESAHRGDVVEVDLAGRVLHAVGDPDRLVTLRSAVKPFSAIAMIEEGVAEAYQLAPDELAVMTASHSGEDLHVRTVQAALRRANVPQSALGCGTGAPMDPVTAARLARDGERPSAIRHMCSGQHAGFLMLCKLKGWPLDGYWADGHPAMATLRSVVARAFGTAPDRLVEAVDACGIPTFAFPLREVARAFAFLADPAGLPAGDSRAPLVPALMRVRDAMMAHPELVAGTRERLDTSLMKALAGRVVAKGGAEGLRGIGILAEPAEKGKGAGRGGAGASGSGAAGAGVARAAARPATGLALTIEDGDASGRATNAATIEALVQVGVLAGAPLRALSRYQRPASLDSHGRVAAEAVAEFELAPLGELLG